MVFSVHEIFDMNWSKNNIKINYFFYLNYFIDPGWIIIVDRGVEYRSVCGWWRMGKRGWASLVWVHAGTNQLCNQVKFPTFSGERGRCLWRPPEGDPVHLSWSASSLKGIPNKAYSIIKITSKFHTGCCISIIKNV